MRSDGRKPSAGLIGRGIEPGVRLLADGNPSPGFRCASFLVVFKATDSTRHQLAEANTIQRKMCLITQQFCGDARVIDRQMKAEPRARSPEIPDARRYARTYSLPSGRHVPGEQASEAPRHHPRPERDISSHEGRYCTSFSRGAMQRGSFVRSQVSHITNVQSSRI